MTNVPLYAAAPFLSDMKTRRDREIGRMLASVLS